MFLIKKYTLEYIALVNKVKENFFFFCWFTFALKNLVGVPAFNKQTVCCKFPHLAGTQFNWQFKILSLL